MSQTILIPIAESQTDHRLRDYVSSLDSQNSKIVCAFFWDALHERAQARPVSQHVAQAFTRSLREEEARKDNIEFHFLHGVEGSLNLALQSQFADLLMLGSPLGMPPQLRKVSRHLRCPVLILSKLPVLFEHVVLVFESESSFFSAFRAFMQFFGERSPQVPITILSLVSDEEEAITMEKYLMQFVQGRFSNVGVLPALPRDVFQVLDGEVAQVQSPLVVAGCRGIDWLDHDDRLNRLMEREAYILYACL